MTDPIADMLTRIRNALAARRHQVSLPHSRLKEAIAGILKDNGFLTGVKTEGEGSLKLLVLELPNGDDGRAITAIDRISKPGRRIYAKSNDIPLILGGRGMVIVSTSNGVMTGREARKRGLGGELICKVY